MQPASDKKQKVYCAGPLFNESEKKEMQGLADALDNAGFDTFLPQRDGLELTACIDLLSERGFSLEKAAQLMSEAIFALDSYQVLFNCSAIVANLNGRVPDEGTVAELSMAWARGRITVGYKRDSRTCFAGKDNPLVAGLYAFKCCKSYEEVVDALRTQFALAKEMPSRRRREDEVSEHAALGNAIWEALRERSDLSRVIEVILDHKHQVTP